MLIEDNFFYLGKEQIVELLIKHGADVNSRQLLTELTPLHKSAQSGNFQKSHAKDSYDELPHFEEVHSLSQHLHIYT